MRGYNVLKLVVLSHLAGRGWQRATEIAEAVGYPRRALYSYLRKQQRHGLLIYREMPYAEFALSERGRDRLAYLREHLD